MNEFWHYKDNILHGGDTSLLTVAQTFGTPSYVYSQNLIEQQWLAYKNALQGHPHHLFYAVKANSNLAILQLLAKLGAGFDIVSGGELKRVLRAGGDPTKVVFSGVGKTATEIEEALKANIYCFNVESLPELDSIQKIAHARGQTARISLRVNPDINAQTHPYISTGLKENKFGISIEDAVNAYRYAATLPNIKIEGVDCHIGSQITQLDPFLAALESVLELVNTLASEQISLQHIDMGGGLGILYQQETPPSPSELTQALLQRLRGRPLTLALEPGRSIVAHAGVLLSRVEYIKQNTHRNFAIIDAGMNDLIRPALYQAWQDIVPVHKHDQDEARLYDVVGPVCESGDFLGKERNLTIRAGDCLAIKDSGAYGFVMSSQYNSRPRAAEVLLTENGPKLIRERETYEDVWKGEKLL
jgi:diaminopimelate decarboxylase